MPSFDHVADEYDAARPAYPAGVYDALGALRGLDVLEIGAGTGQATRSLVDRGARVVALDVGHRMLTHARAHLAALPAVVADGARLPFADGSFNLVCCAQAWHWLDGSTRCVEAHRVLRPGGRWAGWWSHARADGEDWFDRYWSEVEATCPAAQRAQRDIDWGRTVADSGLFVVGARVVVPWRRRVDVTSWLTDLSSHSYISVLPAVERAALLERLRTIVTGRFADGVMDIPYETWLWVGTAVG